MACRKLRLKAVTFGDMQDEISQILLQQADQIMTTAGRRAAEDFIGFKLEEEFETFGHRHSSQLNLCRFEISEIFERAYRFIKEPCQDNLMHDDAFKLKAFVFHAPRSGNHSAICERPMRFMTSEGICRHVADTAYARWKLEVLRRRSFSVREMALLADLGDEDVQTYILSTDPDRRLCAVQYSKSTEINWQEALIWLAGQAGFKSSWTGRQALTRVSTLEEFGAFIRYHRVRSKKPLDLRERFVGPDTMREWERDSTVYEPALAAVIARQLDLDVPLFVGKAMEISFRHEETAGDLAGPRGRQGSMPIS